MKKYGHFIQLSKHKSMTLLALIVSALPLSITGYAQALDSQGDNNKPVDITAIKNKQVLNIIDVYELAVLYDAEFAAAKAKRKTGVETVKLARSNFLPKISASVNTTLSDSKAEYISDTASNPGAPSITDSFEENPHYNSHGYTISLVQPVFNLKNLYQWPEAKLREKLTELQFISAQHHLIEKVGRVYVEKIIAEENLIVAEAQLDAIKEHLEQAKLSFELGSVTITDTHEAQAAYDVAYAQMLAAKTALINADHKLISLTGHSNKNLMRIRSKLPLDIEEFQLPDIEELKPVTMKANVQLNMARIQQALAQINIRLLQSQYTPTLNIVANGGENNANSSNFGTGSDTEFYTIGLQLNVPIFSGGSTSSRVRSAKIQLQEKDNLLLSTQRQVELGLYEAYHNVVLAKSQLVAFNQALESTKSSLESTKLGFQVGERTGLDVLTVQKNYYSALRDRANAQYQYILAALQLNLVVGILSEDDIYRLGDLIISYAEE